MRVTVRRTEERPATGETPVETELEEEAPAAAEAGPPPVAPGVVRIEAPMVGTFYRAPQPGAPPFVEEGDTVANGQTLCILEAMKLMNEIKAEHDAIVRSIKAQNAQPVEYGQLLFELEPLTDGRPSLL
jgi:acetyl-CoA carboxylase biotin carboxyl carrier protein